MSLSKQVYCHQNLKTPRVTKAHQTTARIKRRSRSLRRRKGCRRCDTACIGNFRMPTFLSITEAGRPGTPVPVRPSQKTAPPRPRARSWLELLAASLYKAGKPRLSHLARSGRISPWKIVVCGDQRTRTTPLSIIHLLQLLGPRQWKLPAPFVVWVLLLRRKEFRLNHLRYHHACRRKAQCWMRKNYPMTSRGSRRKLLAPNGRQANELMIAFSPF